VIDLRLGDCLDVMATLADASVDAVVTDPPYSSGGGIPLRSV
jgi:DNA modification methylase